MVITMSEKTKKIIGDGKKIMLRTNSDSLLIIGSGNTVKVEDNQGKIKVIGDGCKVSIGKGDGRIVYRGDGGYLETGSDVNTIKYKGDGGRIVRIGKESDKTKKSDKSESIQVKNTSKCQISVKGKFPSVTIPNISLFVIGKTHP